MMSKRVFAVLIFIWVGGFIFAGSVFAGKYSPVVFTIPIKKEMFGPQGQIRVLLFNEVEKKRADATAQCTVSFDLKTGRERKVCPPGTKDVEAKPEIFNFPVQQIRDEIEIVSRFVRVGETYRLNISGMSFDNCNTTSATITGRAHSADIRLRDFQWAQTQMACPDMVMPPTGRGNPAAADIKEQIPAEVGTQAPAKGSGLSRPGFIGKK